MCVSSFNFAYGYKIPDRTGSHPSMPLFDTHSIFAHTPLHYLMVSPLYSSTSIEYFNNTHQIRHQESFNPIGIGKEKIKNIMFTQHCFAPEIKMTLNYRVIVERYPFLNGVVGGSIDAVKFSLLDMEKKLAR